MVSTTIFREEQAPPLRKILCDSANAKPYKHTQTLALRKVMHEAIHIIRIVRFFKVNVGAVVMMYSRKY